MGRGLSALLLLLFASAIGASQAATPLPWLYHVAEARMSQGSYRLALAALDSLARSERRLPYEAYRLYVLAYLRSGNSDSVQYYMQRAAQRGSPHFALLAAQVACQQRRIDEGIGHLQAYLRSKRAVAERKLWADTLLRPCRDTAAWKELWLEEWYSISQQQDDDLTQRAEEGNWEYLIERLDQMSAYARQRSKYAHFRALALQGLRDYPAALEVALRNAKREPRHEDYMRLAAELALQNGNPQLALRITQRYLNHDPHSPSMLPLLAEALCAVGELRSALAAARRYLELHPLHGRCLMVAARAATQAGLWMPALEAIATLLPRTTNDTVAQLQMLRAQALLATGRPKLALEELEAAARVRDDRDTALLMLLAKSHRQLGDRAAMCRALSRAADAGHRIAQQEKQLRCPRIR